MKKLGFILMACALIMGTVQCKKNDETNKPENGESVFITLNVGGGTRANVIPEDDIAPVYYAEGDMIHVVSHGKYIGTLTYNGSNFDGNITNPTEGQPLHFYFLGNVTPNETLVVGETSTCSVVIRDQTTSHPVISYAPSTVNYSVGTTNYTATLLNKCALVKFNVTTVSENATCITGMNNKVTVDFETNEFAYSQEDDGIITLSVGDGEKWVILLPQDEMNQTEAHSADGIYSGSCASIPAIAENDYHVNGITVVIDRPMGTINGLFTVNVNGDQVYFSKGNLQYIGSASIPYWKFADNQWGYFGKTTGQNNSNQNVNRDLFGWGTSGWHDSCDPFNVNYQPWSTSKSSVNVQYNCYGYGPSTNMSSPNLTGSSAFYDWGVYNPIANGGNQSNQWRTLTGLEWRYVFQLRTTSSGILYAMAKVNNVNGVILLPDNWNSSIYNLNDTNYAGEYWSNIIGVDDWTNILEANGAVFLPAAGERDGVSVNYAGSWGYYWSTSYFSTYYAHYVYFTDWTLNTIPLSGGRDRYFGRSIRLVQDY